jgi:hypothetical protein
MCIMHGPGGNMGRGHGGGPGGFPGGGPGGFPGGGPRGFGGMFGLGMGRGLFRRGPGMGCMGCLGYVLSSLFIIILFSFFIGMLIT